MYCCGRDDRQTNTLMDALSEARPDLDSFRIQVADVFDRREAIDLLHP